MTGPQPTFPMTQYPIPNDKFTQQLQRIGALIGKGKLQEAALALNQAQKQAPKDARVPLLGVRLAETAGNWAGATLAARRAVDLEPQWPVALMELASSLARQNQGDEALQYAARALKQGANDPQLLTRALAIASQVGVNDEAMGWAEAGHQLYPEDLRYPLFLAEQLVRRKELTQARGFLDKVLAAEPDNKLALRGALVCAVDLEDNASAIDLADRLLALSPEDANVQYAHAVAHGQTPPTLPGGVVTSLFDDYATSFDLHLVRGLQYRAPEQTAKILNELYPDRRFNVLDLGCGTGLLGVYLGPINGFIVGVDLSEKMIEQAVRHNVYARFYNVNVLDALRDTPADHYEVITCLDVLVYVGDLSTVIPNAYRILKAGGHFIFTCEAATEEEEDLVLRESQRYAHKASHVERLCREAGFDDVRVEHLPALRMEYNKPLPGFLMVAHKPAA